MKYLRAIENTQLIAVHSIYNLFRIQYMTCEKNPDSSYIYKATLYREYRTLRVTWLSANERKDLGYGVLVRADWLTKQVFLEGTNIINTVTSVKKLSKHESLDETVIPAWMLDGFAVGALMKRVSSLPEEYRWLINQVMKNHYVFYHFLKTPWSLNEKFNTLGGNLERTLLQLTFLETDRVSERLMRPHEQLMAAVILLGIGHYNQFEYDNRSHCYVKRPAKAKHDPRTVAVDLVNQARKTLDMERLLWIDRLINVIMHEEFDF